VTFIDIWPAHVDEMKKNGLRITHHQGEEPFTVKVRALHLTEAQQLASRAAGASDRHQARRLMRRGVKALKQATAIAARAARKGTISRACAASVRMELGHARVGADRWLRSR